MAETLSDQRGQIHNNFINFSDFNLSVHNYSYYNINCTKNEYINTVMIETCFEKQTLNFMTFLFYKTNLTISFNVLKKLLLFLSITAFFITFWKKNLSISKSKEYYVTSF